MKPTDTLYKYTSEFPALCEALVQLRPGLFWLKIPLLGRLLARFVSLELTARLSGISGQELIQFISTRIGESCGCFTGEKPKKDFGKSSWTSKSSFDGLTAVRLDARPLIDQGIDPFKNIMQALEKLGNKEYLVLINYFEPVPLYYHLKEKGFVFYAEKKGSFFHINIQKSTAVGHVKKEKTVVGFYNIPENKLERIENDLKNHEPDKLHFLDVCDLPAPEPLLKIMEALSGLPQPLMLKIKHRKLPLHLPEFLKEKAYLVSAYEKKDQVIIYVFRKILLDKTVE